MIKDYENGVEFKQPVGEEWDGIDDADYYAGAAELDRGLNEFIEWLNRRRLAKKK